MIVERPYLDKVYIEGRIAALDEQICSFMHDGATYTRAASLLPELLLNRLLHLLAFDDPDWAAAERAAVDVLDSYESLISLVGSATRSDGQADSSRYRASLTLVDFFNAFWIATIVGDVRRLDLLARMPIGDFVSPRVEADRFLYSWVEALQCLQAQDESWVQKLGDAIYFSDPARVEIATDDSLHYLLYPPIKLFHSLVAGTEADFNFELEDALVRHRYLWVDASDRPFAPEGWVSLPLTAIACMALGKGYRIEPASRYLPLPLGLDKG